jgi:hypothetical protein
MIKIQNKTKITLNNSKITKQPLKNPKPSGICRNSVEEGFWVREQCWNSGGAWVHASPPMKVTELVDRERLPLLCLPTPAVTCKTTENTTGI